MILFFLISLSHFGIEVILALQNEFENGIFSLTFWKTLEMIGINSSVNV